MTLVVLLGAIYTTRSKKIVFVLGLFCALVALIPYSWHERHFLLAYPAVIAVLAMIRGRLAFQIASAFVLLNISLLSFNHLTGVYLLSHTRAVQYELVVNNQLDVTTTNFFGPLIQLWEVAGDVKFKKLQNDCENIFHFPRSEAKFCADKLSNDQLIELRKLGQFLNDRGYGSI